MFTQTINTTTSRFDSLKRKKVKGFDPYIKVMLVHEATGSLISAQRTETVKNGGPNCEFERENKIEFEVNDYVADSKTASGKKQGKILVIEVWDEDMGNDDLIGRAVVRLENVWPITSRPKAVKAISILEVLTPEEESLGEKSGGRGKVFASIYRDGPESNKIVVECWCCRGLINEEEGMSTTTTLLLISLVLLVIYFVIGIAVFATSDGMNKQMDAGDFPGKRVLNAAYFTVIIATTIGYGDVLPLSDGMKIFTAFYALFAVAFIGAALGIVTSYMADLRDQLALKLVSANKDSGDDTPPSLLRSLITPIGTISVLLFIGTIWFHFFEQFDLAVSFYTSMITLLTVGYGDFSFNSGTPKHPAGRVFGIFYTLIGTLCFARAMGAIIYSFILSKLENIADWRLGMVLTPELLDKMDEDHSGSVSEKEFVQFMMQHVTKVTASDIQLVRKRFREVDEDGSKFVTKSDLVPAIDEIPTPQRTSSLTQVEGRMAKSPQIDKDDIEMAVVSQSHP